MLKYQFAFHEPEDDYFLIWDADTIPLRKLEFFDGQGRMLLTKAEEYHPPYFQTYEKILGQPRTFFPLNHRRGPSGGLAIRCFEGNGVGATPARGCPDGQAVAAHAQSGRDLSA